MGGKVKTFGDASRVSDLLAKAKELPETSGCYLMKNGGGDVHYVGKALNLRKRVMSYFNHSAKNQKTLIMVSHTVDFEFILTQNDTEAFVLENNLIKKFTPKYNILMRDDKSYPYVVFDFNEPFPRPRFARRVKFQANQKIFGPYVVGSNISEIIRILIKSFQLRDCSISEFKKRKIPCLLHQLNQCSAPCVGLIEDKKYLEELNHCLDFFKGKSKGSLNYLKEKMDQYANNEEFEKAAQLRDYIFYLEEFLKKSIQKNAELKGKEQDIDVVSFYEGVEEVDICIYIIRKNILMGNKNFHFHKIDFTQDTNEEILDFLLQYYSNSFDTLPEKIILNFEKTKRELLQSALKIILKENRKKEISVNIAGNKYKNLIELTTQNALEYQKIRLSKKESTLTGLIKLQELLHLKERPTLLECYDVAVFQGSSPTAAQIVFQNGTPIRELYRHYKLKTRPEGNNDFAMMREVLSRRLKKGNLPDIFIVDGGKGQVSVFREVLKEENVEIPVVGIAKEKIKLSKEKSDERLIIPGRANPYSLKKCMPLFKILVQMRDEAHRFSRRLHHKKEKEKILSTWADEVNGIGPKTKQKILKKLDKTPSELLEMGTIELSQYFDISQKMAILIKDHLEKNFSN